MGAPFSDNDVDLSITNCKLQIEVQLSEDVLLNFLLKKIAVVRATVVLKLSRFTSVSVFSYSESIKAWNEQAKYSFQREKSVRNVH